MGASYQDTIAMSEDVKSTREAIANKQIRQNRAKLSYNELPSEVRDAYDVPNPHADWAYADMLMLALVVACVSIGEDPLFSLLPRSYRETVAEHVYKQFL